jgi:prepilin-type N-terminal cleavage/methylation domain-containing protein
MPNKKRKFFKGMSLIESMAALSILLVGVLSSYFLLMKALASYRFIEDRLIAANLAQQKIEEIRQIRDNNYANWYRDYVINKGSWSWNRNLNCNYIRCNETLFNKFNRVTTISSRQNNKEIVIIVTISWTTKDQSFNYKAESHLFDWANLPSR